MTAGTIARKTAGGIALVIACFPLACFLWRCTTIAGSGALLPDARRALATLAYAGCVTGVSLLCGAACGVWLVVQRGSLAKLIALLLTLPLLLPAAVVAISFHTSLGTASRISFRWPSGFGGSFGQAVIIATLCYTPLVSWLVWMGLRGIPAAPLGFARLHFSWLRSLGLLGLHFARSELAAAGLVVFVLVLQDFDISNITGLDTVAAEMYVRASNLMPADQVAAASFPLVAGTLAPLVGLAWLALARTERSLRASDGILRQPGPRRIERAVVLSAAAPLAVGAGVAFWNLIVASRSVGDLLDAWRESAPDLLRSAGFSLASTGLALILAGAMLPWCMGSRLLRGLALALVLASFAIPPGSASLVLLEGATAASTPMPTGVLGGPARLVYVLAVRVAPVALLVIAAGSAGKSRRSLQLAAVHRVAWHRRIQLHLAALGPHIRLAGAIGFIMGMRELELFVLHAPPGATTLTVRIFNALHFGAPSRTAGLCIVLALASASSFLLLWPGSLPAHDSSTDEPANEGNQFDKRPV